MSLFRKKPARAYSPEGCHPQDIWHRAPKHQTPTICVCVAHPLYPSDLPTLHPTPNIKHQAPGKFEFEFEFDA